MKSILLEIFEMPHLNTRKTLILSKLGSKDSEEKVSDTCNFTLTEYLYNCRTVCAFKHTLCECI